MAVVSSGNPVYTVGYQVIKNHDGKVGNPGQREFEPLYNALKAHLLEQSTTSTLMKHRSMCLRKTSNVTCGCTAQAPTRPEPHFHGINIVLFDYQNSRFLRACPVGFLGDYSGYLQSDGYGAYDGLTKVTNVGCFAHARRKFMEAKKPSGKENQVKRMWRWRKSKNCTHLNPD